MTVSTFAVPLGLSSQVSGDDVLCEHFWFACTLSDLLGCAHFLWMESCAHLSIHPHAEHSHQTPSHDNHDPPAAVETRSWKVVRLSLARETETKRVPLGAPRVIYDITILQNGYASYVHTYVYTHCIGVLKWTCKLRTYIYTVHGVLKWTCKLRTYIYIYTHCIGVLKWTCKLRTYIHIYTQYMVYLNRTTYRRKQQTARHIQS